MFAATMYGYPKIYERLGMQLGHFGAIMLDVEPIAVSDILGTDQEWFYVSENPMLRYVKGPVGEIAAHATLLYGLTPNDTAGIDQKESVDELLTGLDLSSVTIESVDSFPPQFNEPYQCVIAHLVPDENLSEANRRLRFLPHVDSFPDFRPHVTLAYVKQELVDEAISRFSTQLIDTTLKATGINYGGKLR